MNILIFFLSLLSVMVSYSDNKLSEYDLHKSDYPAVAKAKRFEETKEIKDYVEHSKERSYEHKDHTHPNPKFVERDPYVDDSKHYKEDAVSGEAEKYHRPSKKSNGVLLPVRRVDDTEVDCQKNHMIITFRFSAAFNGFIYPYEHFTKCILFSGQNTNEATLTLHHGTCGQKHISTSNERDFSPVIEHRLMIQWERDFVCEDDSSIIVRCDRPDDFNKTISWNFKTTELASTLERNTHPGPKMWMEIQRGEGPSAPPLDDKPTFLGDVLTIVFTLSDDVFWFGSNILSCSAVDGGDNDENIYELDKYAPSLRSYSGQITVIENECSTRPKIFSHFFKESITKDGNLVTLHYAHFKAFRFPTSQKVVLQCDVQVCYKKCEELPPCSVGFHPRAAAKERQRREALRLNESRDTIQEGTELDTVLLYRTIEVFSPEDGALREIPVKTVLTGPGSVVVSERLDQTCYSSRTFYGWIAVLALSTIFLLFVLVWYLVKSKTAGNKVFETPPKN